MLHNFCKFKCRNFVNENGSWNINKNIANSNGSFLDHPVVYKSLNCINIKKLSKYGGRIATMFDWIGF